MLQAKTKEQRDYVELLVKEESCDGKVSIFEDGVDYTVDSCFSVGISFDTMSKIVDYLRGQCDKDDELFEECWKSYRRKGNKKKSKEYWRKLKDSERHQVLPHIKSYVLTRELVYQKDFERYLRDKTFTTIVLQGNSVIYDPIQSKNPNTYTPATGGALSWNDYYKCYMYVGYWDGHIADGYTDDSRPDGACVTLNNGRGDVVWNGNTKMWERK